jgi:hypothetical protein
MNANRALTQGMLAIWHDVLPEHAAEVREWYGREHHFERIDIPGFREARRFDRIAGQGGDIFGMYRVESPAVLQSDAYRTRIGHPSAWTQAAMRYFRGMSRTVCQVLAEAGRADGGHLAALAAGTADPSPPPVAHCRALLGLRGVLRVRCIAPADAALPQPAATPETVLRGGADASVGWALLIDADSADAARHALDAAQSLTGLAAPAQAGVYRLAFAVYSDD